MSDAPSGSEAEHRRLRRLTDAPVSLGTCATVLLWFLATYALAVAGGGGGAALEGLWLIGDGEVLRAAGGLDAVAVWDRGAWWRVLTGWAVHGSWLHVGLNIIALLSVGPWVERAQGSVALLCVFLAGCFGGELGSLAFAEAPIVVGMSGGVFGVAGALLLARLVGDAYAREVLRDVNARELGFWVGLWLLVGWALPLLGDGWGLIAQAGHVFGLLCGGLVGGLLGGITRIRRRERHGASVFGVSLVGLLGLFGFLGVYAGDPLRPGAAVMRGYAALDEERPAEAAHHFERALLEQPRDVVLLNARAYALAEAGEQLDVAVELANRALGLLDAEAGEAQSELRGNVLDTLGWALCRQGRAVEGRDRLGQALEAMDDRPGVEVMRGHLEDCDSAAVPRGTSSDR